MRRIAVVTTTRAEYGLLSPLIRRIECDGELELDLIITGGHLSKSQGMTEEEIVRDGVYVTHRVPILDKDNSPYGISMTMANAVQGFADCFRKDRPDMLVVLGDRTELLGVAFAAANERIPIAHIHGGETTEGAIDECIRHSITKMSYLHFTTCEAYRHRVIQLGEAPERVFNVGALGVENVKNVKKMTREELAESLGFDLTERFLLITFHPVTLEDGTANEQFWTILEALEKFPEYKLLFTKANADAGGESINRLIDEYVIEHRNRSCAVYSLGMKRYISALSLASVVVGNSSSGILETPTIPVATVNIGDRQKGRIQAENIINCQPICYEIAEAIQTALSNEFQMKLRTTKSPYGEGDTSSKILCHMKHALCGEIQLKKRFYDVNF